MDPLDTCPIPGRRDTSKAARRRTRLAICAEKWADGVDPLRIMHTWGTTYDGMRSMIRANPDIKLPDDMAKRLHKICREAYPKNQPNRHRSGWDQYEKQYYTEEILFLDQFNVPALEILNRLDVSWTMWKHIINEQHLTRLQQETDNACQWANLRKQHPDKTDQEITQMMYNNQVTFSKVMKTIPA